MTTARLVRVTCDWPGCDAQLVVQSDSVARARRIARQRHQYRHVEGFDFCGPGDADQEASGGSDHAGMVSLDHRISIKLIDTPGAISFSYYQPSCSCGRWSPMPADTREEACEYWLNSHIAAEEGVWAPEFAADDPSGGPLVADSPPPRWRIVAGTGHRPQHLTVDEAEWGRAQLPSVLRRLHRHHGTRVIRSGLALGWDTWLAVAALEAGIQLHAHVPFPQQADIWSKADRMLWQSLIQRAAKVVYYGERHETRLLYARNSGMLKGADAVLALWDASKGTGGTAGTVSKAVRGGIPVIHLDPVSKTLERRDPDARVLLPAPKPVPSWPWNEH